MEDREIFERINELAQEEHDLERSHASRGLGNADAARMRDLQVMLDQCWDLLRQRRARRNAGQDPDEAEARPEQIVENYRQ